ncbi:MAG: RNA polymerase sigma factor RpoE [Calditrichia bacterium]
MDEREIVSRVLAGETDAYSEIVRKYQPQLFGVVQHILGKRGGAEDIVQEAFIRFYRNLANFRWESGVGTYLTRIAINLAYNEIRRKSRWLRVFSREDDQVHNISGENKTGYDDTAEIIQRAISRLPEDFQKVVILRLIEGYSVKETAEILDIPVGTVLSRLKRAQEKLKNKLAPILEERYEN